MGKMKNKGLEAQQEVEEKRLILSFKGTKVELHKQLKVWCAKNNSNMNVTILELIEDHLK